MSTQPGTHPPAHHPTAMAVLAALLEAGISPPWHRQLDIVGKLKVEVERIRGQFEGIGAHRAMAITLPMGRTVEAYPVVGVPTAEMLNDIHTKATKARHGRFPCLVYDHTGIRPAWLDHLAWLDDNLEGVRTLKILGAGYELIGWES